MKRVLLFAAFLRVMSLFAQNTGAPNDPPSGDPGTDQRAPDDQRSPWAQATVSSNPQGLPVVNTQFSPWPLGTALQDSFQGPQAPAGIPPAGTLPAGTPGGNSAPQRSSGDQVPPPASSGAPAPSPAQTTSRTQSSVRTQPQSPATRRAQGAQNPPPSQEGSGRVVVVPSPVHYDRAGRRVLEPGWQETLTQIVQAERAADAAAAAAPAVQETAAEPARETLIVVPGPTVWRIRGTLTVAKGMLALDGNDGVLWYLPGLERYIGFIDGLDAGEEAILEGYAPALGSSQERYFQPLRLFLDDMDYDLSIPPYGFVVQPYLTDPLDQARIRQTERPPLNRTGTDRTGAEQNGEARNGEARNGEARNGEARNGEARTEAAQSPQAGERQSARQENPDRSARKSRDQDRPWSRRTPPPTPVWQHDHTSPWAPPTSVFDYKIDSDSFWEEDPAKQERRERESREIWY